MLVWLKKIGPFRISLSLRIMSEMNFQGATQNMLRGYIATEYNQRVIIKFLHDDRLNTDQITDELRPQCREDLLSLRGVQFWIAEVRRSREDFDDDHRPGRPFAEDLTPKIRELSDENPFESTRAIGETFRILHSNALRSLHQDRREKGSRC
jgi:hypothetical protein